MKKLLILNGGHSEISLIKAAKELGYYVITSGNNPALIGHQYADLYVEADYSDKEKMLEIAAEHQISAVVSCANDFGAISASYVAEKMGLPGHDPYKVTELLHQKDSFKRFAQQNSLQVSPSDDYQNISDALEMREKYLYPMIVKPVDMTGGKGVSRVDDALEYEAAVKKAFEKSRKGRIVVEKYIEGTYHSFSTFLVDKKVIAYFSDNEYSFRNPYFVATSAGPATYAEHVAPILKKQAELIADKLNLVNGVFHMQYVMDCNMVPYIIDITRRCSGDVYPEPVEHATGIPWSKWIVMAEIGCPGTVFTERGTQNKFCGRHCIMAEENGVVEDVIIADEIKGNIYKELLWWKKGDIIENYFLDKIGILFLEYASEKEMLDKTARIAELVKVKLK